MLAATTTHLAAAAPGAAHPRSAPRPSAQAVFSRRAALPRRQARAAARAAADAPAAVDPKYAAGAYPNWDDIYKQLSVKYRLRSVPVQDAQAMVQAGRAVVLDARLARDHEEAHPEGSVSTPAFRVITLGDNGGFPSLLKAALMMANGVTPTEVRCAALQCVPELRLRERQRRG
jgi:hypothetical protein